MNEHRFDAIVVGSGPAGMAAAIELSRRGLQVVAVDEQSRPGGQIYRAAEGNDAPNLFGKSYTHGLGLIKEFRRQPIDYRPETTLINVGGSYHADVMRHGRVHRLNARAIVLATGAYERPLVVPGWTLPGVMTAGAAQVLAKQSGTVPRGSTVLAGRGPLVWLLAWQYRRLGVPLSAIVTVGSRHTFRQSVGHLPDFLTSDYFREGLRYLTGAYRSTHVMRARRIVRIEGKGSVKGMSWETHGGRSRTIPADTVLLHNGVIPDGRAAGALGCEQQWNERQQYWQPKTDSFCRSSLPGVYVAGDGAGIEGAGAAESSGRLAAVDASIYLGKLPESERRAHAAAHLSDRARHLRGRAFIDALYAPVIADDDLDTETLICRCESVSVAGIAAAVAGGANRLAAIKALTRCGMGPCQGRVCAPSMTALLSERFDIHPTVTGPPSHRFPIKPVALDALATMEFHEADLGLHVRE